MDDIRCPFCVEGNAFKLMTGIASGRFICDRCGHVAQPLDERFICTCPNCRQLNRPLSSERSDVSVVAKGAESTKRATSPQRLTGENPVGTTVGRKLPQSVDFGTAMAKPRPRPTIQCHEYSAQMLSYERNAEVKRIEHLSAILAEKLGRRHKPVVNVPTRIVLKNSRCHSALGASDCQHSAGDILLARANF